MARVICQQCNTRPVRRFCPGVREEICSVCCGTERENSIDCPFECEYLRESREHEKPVEIDRAQLPNADIKLTEEFLQAREPLIVAAGRILFTAAVETQAAIDLDVREALGALIKTYRTLDSGLVYETRPANPMAAEIQGRFQAGLQQLRNDIQQRTGLSSSIPDKDVLGVLVFWERMELQRNNGRRRSRAFIESLLPLLPPPPAPGEALAG